MIIIRRAKSLRRGGEFSVSSIQLVSLRDTSGIEKLNDARTRFFFFLNDEKKRVGFMRRNKTKKWHAANTTKKKEESRQSTHRFIILTTVGCAPVLHHRTKRSNDVMSRAQHPSLYLDGDEETHPDGIGLISPIFSNW